jgi:hypothetical protein
MDVSTIAETLKMSLEEVTALIEKIEMEKV